MIIWVKAEATDAACDQRAEVKHIVGERIYITLLGSGAPAIVMAGEVVGLELTDSMTICFNVTGIRRRYVNRVAT